MQLRKFRISGTTAKPAIPALTIALQDSDQLVQRESPPAISNFQP
jgi:hypothetical protein